MFPNYITVETTPGRISKGLLSIPVSLTDIFPKQRQKIFLMFDDSRRLYEKPFSPYESTTRECRINGLRHWYKKHNAKGDEQVVITVIDKANFVYRLCFEEKYLMKTSSLEEKFYTSKSENAADNNLKRLADWTGNELKIIALNQYKNLANISEETLRKKFDLHGVGGRERAPYSIKSLLSRIYNGRCQVCDFTFQKKDGQNYFEIHHIRPKIGHNPKNLLVVCPNCHRQFEFAEVIHWFNPQNWLVKVKFNLTNHKVNQIFLNNIATF